MIGYEKEKASSKLFATGSSNWDYFARIEENGKPSIYSIAKPGSGAGDSWFGPIDHISSLIREDCWDGEFTEYGRKLMKEYGQEKYLERHEKPKTYSIKFFDSSRVYGKLLRETRYQAKSRSEAYSFAYSIRKAEEKDIEVKVA